MNFQMFKLVLEKAEEKRDQIANIRWIIVKAREFQKNIYFCFTDYVKAFGCMDHNKLENSSRDGNTRCDLPPEKSMQVKNYFANKGPSSQGYGFSSGQVWM